MTAGSPSTGATTAVRRVTRSDLAAHDRTAPGTVVISDRALKGLVQGAVLELPEVWAATRPDRRGSKPPKVTVSGPEDRPTIAASVPIIWPQPAASVANEARLVVRDRLSSLAGRRPGSVDVTVSEVISPSTRAERLPLPAAEQVEHRTVPAPRATTAATAVGPLCALALLTAGGIAIHDLLAAGGWINEPQWFARVARWLAELHWSQVMVPAAIAAAAIGLLLLWIAVKPRRRTHRQLVGAPELCTRRSDIGARVRAVTLAVPGINSVRVSVGRRTVTVRAKPEADCTATDSTLLAQISEALTAELDFVYRRPRLRVTVAAHQPKEARR